MKDSPPHPSRPAPPPLPPGATARLRWHRGTARLLGRQPADVLQRHRTTGHPAGNHVSQRDPTEEKPDLAPKLLPQIVGLALAGPLNPAVDAPRPATLAASRVDRL